MYLSKHLLITLLPVSLIYPCSIAHANIELTNLKGFSSCMAHEYRYLSPAIGALFQTYAKNLTLLGNQTSEAVILLRELFATIPDTLLIQPTSNPTSIGMYLDPVDIGTIIGLVVQHKNGNIDAKKMTKMVNGVLKKIVTRKQYEIKKAIADELQKAIARENTRYTELEKTLIALADKKERSELETALKAVSRSWDTNTETAVINKLNASSQRKLFNQLKNIHRNIKHNRSLLDTEKRTTEVASPMLKDSMGAFANALIGAIAEEGTIYLPNNTTNLLLTLLWQKAQTKDDLLDALKAMAQSMSIAPDKLYQWKNQKPYNINDYEALKKKTESEIDTLPLEDIVFARLAHTLYESPVSDSTQSSTADRRSSITHAVEYVKSFVRQLETDQPGKAIVQSLAASWATQWSDIKDMDQNVQYCRFLMQPADTVAERIALVLDICHGKIPMTGKVNYYLDAINNIYLSLPKDIDTQQMFFDAISTFIINSQESTAYISLLKKDCLQWIQQADNNLRK